MISVDKPGSPSEILEHFGRKGMKWGVRQRSQAAGYKAGKAAAKEARAAGAGVGGRRKAGRAAYKTTSKETSRNLRAQNKATKAARPAQKGIAPGRASREFRAKNPTAKTQARAIRGARKESNARMKAINNMKKKDSVEAARLLRDHLNNPSTAVALRTTRGEKTAVGIIAGAFLAGSKPGGVGRTVPTYTTAVAIGNVTQRRSIEKKQRKGGFK